MGIKIYCNNLSKKIYDITSAIKTRIFDSHIFYVLKDVGQSCYRVRWPHSKRMGVMLMKNKFSFNDLMQFGIFLIALLTFIYLISH